MQRLVLQPLSSGQSHRVELGGTVPQEGRFENVAALAVDQESALVYVQLFAYRLEVQGN